jgi:hypothetical protein
VKNRKFLYFYILLYVHFLCLPLCPLGCLYPVFKGAKKTNQQRSGERKGTQSLVRHSRIPSASRISQALRNSRIRGAQTVLALFLADSAMLGCVKWGLKDGVTKLSQFFINNNG